MSEMSIGIDLGGTNMRAGLVKGASVLKLDTRRVNSNDSMEDVLQDLFDLTDTFKGQGFHSIGIGVPSVVDINKGIVYDVQNIPSWKKVFLKQLMEERYQVPVFVNNDSNCFAIGEFYFGKGRGRSSMIGLTIGTGLGAGIIIDKKLYTGTNCGAGEFGMVEYLDKYFEYYASGQFFYNVYAINGQEVFQKAIAGDPEALAMYREMGMHLGNALKMILYTYDPELIIVGGSLKNAWPYFSESMWERVRTFAYPESISHLRIEISELENSGVLGAAALGRQ